MTTMNTKKNNLRRHGTVATVSQQELDPKLTELFSKSFGPVQSHEGRAYKITTTKAIQHTARVDTRELDDQKTPRTQLEGPEVRENSYVENKEVNLPNTNYNALKKYVGQGKDERSSRRKRKHDDDYNDLEAAYMQKLEHKEIKDPSNYETSKSPKRARTESMIDDDKTSVVSTNHSGLEDEESDCFESAGNIVQQTEHVADSNGEPGKTDTHQIPQHESISSESQDRDLEKSLRTIFAGNISSEAMTSKSSKKTLLKHFSSFLSELPSDSRPHKIESIRFRSTAYSNSTPRKAAYIAKDLMPATTKSTNAYVVYTTKLAAREAAKRLNGTIVLDRHVRVDEVAHPAKVDHRRCVFVGKLGYVDDESNMAAAANEDEDSMQGSGQKRLKKAKQPSDVEEGLWRQFSCAGTVESVRMVRDAKTRVGKGFAYVQFTDPNAVEAALLYNEKSFPPLLPRKLRVIRAKAIKRNKPPPSSSYAAFNNRNRSSTFIDPKIRSIQGRALNMLGRAGAAQVWKQQQHHHQQKQERRLSTSNRPNNEGRQKFVFEGVRASKGDGGITRGRKQKKKTGNPKPDGRGRRRPRTTAWKTRSRT